MRRILAFCFVVFLVAVSFVQADEKLDNLKSIYATELGKIDAQHADMSEANKVYIKALAGLKHNAAKKADVSLAMAVAKEQQRFKDFSDLTSEAPSDQPEAIKLAQAKYKAALQKEESYKNAKIVNLSQKYVKGLKGLASGYIKANDFDSAQAVDTEIKKIESVIGDLALKLPSEAIVTKRTVTTTSTAVTPKAKPAIKQLSLAISQKPKQFTCKAASKSGVKIGTFKAGTKVQIVYASGEWTEGRLKASPDDENNASVYTKIQLCEVSGGDLTSVEVLPSNTAKTPFVYECQNSCTLALRINDDLNYFQDNSGSVTYVVSVLK